jgi:hypothetical protein
MNLIGKIFVFAVFVMSLVLMTFAGAVYVSHTNWKDEIERTPEQCIVGQRPGYKYLLQEAETERQTLQDQITSLSEKVGATERARDQVVAKLQSALSEKSGELDKLRQEQAALRTAEQELTERVKVAQDELKEATARVETLRKQVADQQGRVDDQVGRAAKLAAELEEAKAFLTMANERKAQLEKQVQNARDLLKQSGLTLDSLPRDRVPTLDGDVLAVAQDSIQVSLGSDDGLQIGHTLEVYRSGEYVGRAVVRTVKPDSAVAVLVKEFSRGIVQRGDKVTTRLKA